MGKWNKSIIFIICSIGIILSLLLMYNRHVMSIPIASVCFIVMIYLTTNKALRILLLLAGLAVIATGLLMYRGVI